jgi:RNA polymerase-binding transcription factor DksA
VKIYGRNTESFARLVFLPSIKDKNRRRKKMPHEAQVNITEEAFGRFSTCLKCGGTIPQEYLMYCDRCFENLAQAARAERPQGFGKTIGKKRKK